MFDKNPTKTNTDKDRADVAELINLIRTLDNPIRSTYSVQYIGSDNND